MKHSALSCILRSNPKKFFTYKRKFWQIHEEDAEECFFKVEKMLFWKEIVKWKREKVLKVHLDS